MSASGQNTIYYKFTFAGKVNRQRQKADQRLRWAGSTNRKTGKGYSGTLSSDGDALKLNFCDVCTTPFTKKQYFNDRVNCTSVELVLKKIQSNSPKPANPVEPQYTHARGGWQAPPLLVSLRGTAPGFPTWLQRLRLGSGLGICFPSVLWSPALSWGSEPLADAASSTSVFQTQRITHRCVYPGFWAWLAVRTDASSSLRTRGACEATQGPEAPGTWSQTDRSWTVGPTQCPISCPVYWSDLDFEK